MNLIEVIAWLVIAGTCLFLIWKLDQAYADNDEIVGWWTEAIDALLAVARQHRTHAETAAALPEAPHPRTVARWWAWLREHAPQVELPAREDGTPEAAAHARAHLRRAVG